MSTSSKIRRRAIDEKNRSSLVSAGVEPVLAGLYASRGIVGTDDLDLSLAGLHSAGALLNADRAAVMLADAIKADKHVVISCDFDVDGCSAGAVSYRALRAMGLKRLDFAMPHRITHGYGLSPQLVRDIAEKFSPDMILTVDCGVSSFEGVEEARRLGIDVLVTDHHLPGDTLPAAACIVNPNQPDCPFPSKNLAGVGVAFYVMLVLRAELRARGAFAGRQEPNLGNLLDLVALATIADVVKLDRNNRILVQQGLQRIRAGRACPGINALMRVAGKDPVRASVFDMGFIVGPRLNAAGRMDDMTVGMQCLLTDDAATADRLATQLDAINKERREVESTMKESALASLEGIDVGDRFSLVLFDPSWHQGVIGIVASRLKDQFNRPAIVFAPGDEGKIKGSGRGIPGLHLRDALDLVDKRHPGMLLAFGGHAAAAGMTCVADRLDEFKDAFEAVVRELLDEAALQQVIETDGDIGNRNISVDLVRKLDDSVWGQGFPAPLFDGVFTVTDQRILKDAHLKLKLDKDGVAFEAIWFYRKETIAPMSRLVYSLGINEWQGKTSVQLLVRHAETVEA